MDSTLDVIIEETIRRKKRGRPKGVKNGDGSKPSWQPQKWKLIHEKIIGLHLLGSYTNIQISKELGCTSQLVTLIINSDEGKKRIEQAIGKFRTEFVSKIPERFNAMALQAMDNMEDILSDENVRKNNPIALWDRSAQVLQSVGKMNRPIDTSKGSNNIQNNFVIAPEQAKSFLKGLQLSEQYEAESNLPKLLPSNEIKAK